MQYRYYMDGVLVNNPGVGESNLSPKIFRDEQKRVITQRIDGSFTWAFEGYDVLRTAFITGFCERVALVIDQRMTPSDTWENLFNGFIYATDCNFFDPNGRFTDSAEVECQITDDSFFSRIDSNRNIKFNLNTRKAKLGDPTTVVAPVDQQVNFFTPTSLPAVYNVPLVRSYLVIDVLEFLVNAMTDNAMTVSAPIFDTGGDFEDLIITTGGAIRFASPGSVGASNTWPYISYDDIWETLWKQFNLWMRISGSVVVIEKASDQYTSATVLTLELQKDIHQTVEQDRLYTKVKFGSLSDQPSAGLYSFPQIRFFTHQQEEYHSSSNCNHGDQELDLVTKFVTDSNVIEDIIVNDNDEYDGEVFLVETDLPGTARAHKYDTFSPNFVYNEGLVNSAVAKRWDGFIPSSIAYYEGTGDTSFHQRLTNVSTDWGAHTAADTLTTITAVDFNFQVSDPAGRYNAGGDFYDVPADGWYTFSVDQRLQAITYDDQSSGDLRFTIVIERLDSGGAPYVPADERRQVTTIQFGTQSAFPQFEADGFQCFTNDRIRVNYEYQSLGPGPGDINFDISTGNFLSREVLNGGGIFFAYLLINIVKWAFQRKLTQADWLALTASPTDTVVVNGVDTHIREVTWDSATQMADFVLLENVTS